MRSAKENAAPPSFSPCLKSCYFETFQRLTPEQVLILIKRAPDKTSDLDLCPLGLFRSLLRFLHVSLRMFPMLVLKRVVFLLCRKRRLFIRALRNHSLTLMTYLTIVPSQTLALFLSCLSGLFMPSCSSI